MKRLLALVLAVCFMLALAACSSQKGGETGAGEGAKSISDAEPEEYNRLGVTFHLPEGTEENIGDMGDNYTYVTDSDIYTELALITSANATDDNIEKLADSLYSGDSGKHGEIKQKKVDGVDAFQFEAESAAIDDKNRSELVTIFNIPAGLIVLRIGAPEEKQDAGKAVQDMVFDSIKIDETAEVEDLLEYYVKGYTAVTEECTITITGYDVFEPGATGNEFGSETLIGFGFKLTNTSDSETMASVEWPMIVEAVQDNDPDAVNSLRTATFSGYDNNMKLMQTIKPGGTIEAVMGYVLSDATTPVKLIFKNSVAGEQVGTMTFNLK